jgi:replicative DNA helicase
MTILQEVDQEQKLASYDGPDRVVKASDLWETLKNRPKESPLLSKLPTLDRTIEGFFPGQLIVISGTTGHGKTTLAETITRSLMYQGAFPLWFTYEIPEADFIGKFHEDYHDKIFMPAKLTQGGTGWISDRVIEASLKYGATAVYIDHLHYLVNMVAKENTSVAVGRVCRELKKLALARKMVIFLICHTMKTRDDEELGLGSVRDSSFIEQEADVVLYVWREKEDQRKTICKVAKNRRRGLIDQKITLLFFKGVYLEQSQYEDRMAERSSGYSERFPD